MGIGGLDKEFSDIFRRAFASRVFPPDIVEQMGTVSLITFQLLLHQPPKQDRLNFFSLQDVSMLRASSSLVLLAVVRL